VLGLRYYRCVTCETVYADLTEPPVCDDCDAKLFEELTDRLGADAYFTRGFNDG